MKSFTKTKAQIADYMNRLNNGWKGEDTVGTVKVGPAKLIPVDPARKVPMITHPANVAYTPQYIEEGSDITKAEYTAGMSGIPKGNQSEAMRRKGIPIATGVIDYFPLALAEVAKVSRVGNDQHNPGQPLHWNRDLSGDESDALMRHFLERGTMDSDGCSHSGKVAWRALAMLQKELEKELKNDQAR